jgi:hypothetical protein
MLCYPFGMHNYYTELERDIPPLSIDEREGLR